MAELGQIGAAWRKPAPPGVYERRPKARPATEVRLDLAAFVGLCERGPVGVATPVSSWSQFQQTFGRDGGGRLLPQSVHQFFVNGGRRCVIVRVVGPATTAVWPLPGLWWTPEDADARPTPVRLLAISPGAWGNELQITVHFRTAPIPAPLHLGITEGRLTGTPNTSGALLPPVGTLLRARWIEGSTEVHERLYFVERIDSGAVTLSDAAALSSAVTLREEVLVDLEVRLGQVRETWPGLGLAPGHPRFLGDALNASGLVRVQPPPGDITSLRIWPDGRATPDQPFPWLNDAPPWIPAVTTRPAVPAYPLSPFDPDPAGADEATSSKTWLTRDHMFANGIPNEPQPTDFSLGTCLDEWDDHHETEPIALLCFPDLIHPTRSQSDQDASTTPASIGWAPRFEACGLAPTDAVVAAADLTIWRALHRDHVGAPDEVISHVQKGGNDYGPTLSRAHQLAIAEAERRGCVVLLDVPPTWGADEIHRWRSLHTSARAAAYSPWVLAPAVGDPTGPLFLFPPCGIVAGLIAASEARGGPAAAPANLLVSGIVGIDQDPLGIDPAWLHEERINLLRPTERGFALLGGRTLSRDTEWTWLSHRRLVDWLGRQLIRDTHWAVFEPSNPTLWRRLELVAERRLQGLFERGVLAGNRPDEAWFVRCDETTTSPLDLDQGRIMVWVGVAPAVPTEMIVFRLSLLRDGRVVTEPFDG